MMHFCLCQRIAFFYSQDHALVALGRVYVWGTGYGTKMPNRQREAKMRFKLQLTPFNLSCIDYWIIRLSCLSAMGCGTEAAWGGPTRP